jgi:hypothetical protein
MSPSYLFREIESPSTELNVKTGASSPVLIFTEYEEVNGVSISRRESKIIKIMNLSSHPLLFLLYHTYGVDKREYVTIQLRVRKMN